MLTISGADWFSRRGGTCRLHAIYIYERNVRYKGIAGEIVKYGSTCPYRKSNPEDGRDEP